MAYPQQMQERGRHIRDIQVSTGISSLQRFNFLIKEFNPIPHGISHSRGRRGAGRSGTFR